MDKIESLIHRLAIKVTTLTLTIETLILDTRQVKEVSLFLEERCCKMEGCTQQKMSHAPH